MPNLAADADKQKILGAKPWLPLDNASKIFLSTMTSADTKVFRFTASLQKDVNPLVLQKALDKTFDEFPLYDAIIRRGVFWYFMEESERKPLAKEESEIVCAQIYHAGHRNLLFRIWYYQNRIHLEVFHSLSDGAGAMSFFQLLLIAYFHYLDEENLSITEKKHMVFPSYANAALSTDAFSVYDFSEQILDHVEENIDDEEIWDEKKRKHAAKVLRIKGKSTKDYRQNILEVHFRTSHILKRARELNATVTSYLAAVYAMALADAASEKQKEKPFQVVLSCPIDLRQHYPNLTARNFFATLMLRYTFRPDREAALEEIVESFTKQLKRASAKENISLKVAKFVRFEKIFLIRIVPLYVKDLVLRLFNTNNNRGITAALTNLGRFRMPEALKNEVEDVLITSSAVRPQMSIISYEKDLSICFSSPLASTAVQDKTVELLGEDGIETTFVVESLATEESKGKVRKENTEKASNSKVPYPQIALGSNFSLAKFLLALACILTLLGYAVLETFTQISIPFPSVLLFMASAILMTSAILRNRHNPAWLILLQSIVLSLALVGIDWIGGYEGWSIAWGLPTVFFASLVSSELVLRVIPRSQNNGLSFHFLSCVLALSTLAFTLLPNLSPELPSVLCAASGALAMIYTLLFRRKRILAEQRRKWHY